MPAKTTIFDSRVRAVHEFGSCPVNTISFNPQGRLLLLAGFGNLAGKVDVFDRNQLAKIATIDAPNTSYCAWSPCGQFLLSATLSPRLRVDNGIKIWHCTGALMHVQAIDELYEADWRPTPVDQISKFGPTIPTAPKPSESARAFVHNAKSPIAKSGAYRPPGARGLKTPEIYKREDERENGSMGSPLQNGRRRVPGAPLGENKANGTEKKRKEYGKQKTRQTPNDGSPRPSEVQPNGVEKPVTQDMVPPPEPAPVAQPEQLDPVAKKMRNLTKKVCLRVRACAGVDSPR